jgi:predicted NodU family carbamoyl transferase
MIIGTSVFNHDNAATLVDENGILTATQNERFTRINDDSSFLVNTINYCFKEARVNIAKIIFH